MSGKYGKDLTVRRTIRLTPKQAAKWDEKGCKWIRAYLDRKPAGRKRKRGSKSVGQKT